MSNGSLLALTTILVCLVGAGCAKKPKTVVIPPTETTDQGGTTGDQGGTTEDTDRDKGGSEPSGPLALEDIFFDYDQSTLRDEALETLNQDASVLLGAGSARVVLEGHCDERGTTEYNLALGDRRANAARDYLVHYGVEASRLSTVSFGEERPFDPGHDESAWSSNRRVHFVKQ